MLSCFLKLKKLGLLYSAMILKHFCGRCILIREYSAEERIEEAVCFIDVLGCDAMWPCRSQPRTTASTSSPPREPQIRQN